MTQYTLCAPLLRIARGRRRLLPQIAIPQGMSLGIALYAPPMGSADLNSCGAFLFDADCAGNRSGPRWETRAAHGNRPLAAVSFNRGAHDCTT